MIYSAAFRALPPAVRGAIYTRMWEVLEGSDVSPKYARLAADDRRAIAEILRDTLTDLPAAFAASGDRFDAAVERRAGLERAGG